MKKKEYPEISFGAAVVEHLKKSGFDFTQEPRIGNARPDFVVSTPEGHKIVIEAKAWRPTRKNVARARHQAQLYKDLSKAPAALMVLKALPPSATGLSDVVAIADLVSKILSLSKSLSSKEPKPSVPEVEKPPKKKIFAAMPFQAKYDDTFLVAMQPAALAVGAVCERVDHEAFSGDVVQQIKTMIKNAVAVIADFSESRPNVLYEAGYAAALAKPVLQICSTPFCDLPFDVRNNKTIAYSIGQTLRLRHSLKMELRKIM
jgi:hypothetical protein